MNSASDIQHTQMILGMAIASAMLGTLLLSLLGRWIGGSWITLIATLAACLLAYQPLIGASLFAGYKTDLLRRILLAAIPFTAVSIALSFKKVPLYARLIFVAIGPMALLYWVFSHFDISVPRLALYENKILPISLAIIAAWALIEPIAKRSPGAAAPIIIGATTAGLSFLLILSAENQAGLMAPIIPATAGGAVLAAVVAALIRKPIDFARGPVLLWLTLIAALFAFMWLDTEKLPVPYLYWIAAAPLLGWVPEIGPIHRLKPWKRESLRLVLVIVPVIVAMILAFKQHKKEAAESGDEYGWVQPAAPIFPSQMPIPNTIPPPTIT
jgi:hypothetical protein